MTVVVAESRYWECVGWGALIKMLRCRRRGSYYSVNGVVSRTGLTWWLGNGEKEANRDSTDPERA